MYESYFGLKEKPFSLTPDPKFIFWSENHRNALNHLLYGVRRREGFVLISGEVGTGKTMLCRTLLGEVEPEVKTALVLNPALTEVELLQTILQELGLPHAGVTKKPLLDRLNEFLLQEASAGQTTALIIDEAQNLSPALLEQVRLLSNLETEKEKLLQIILVGQRELEEKLRSPSLRQLNQRISVRFTIQPLTRAELPRYIAHRLTVAGAGGGIVFSREALDDIYWASGGVPRLINLVCDRALLAAYVQRTRQVRRAVVRRAVADLRNGALGDLTLRQKRRRRLEFAVIVLALAACLWILGTLLFPGGVHRVGRSPGPPSETGPPGAEKPKVSSETSRLPEGPPLLELAREPWGRMGSPT